MWTYRMNNEETIEDGFILVSPDGRDVGLIDKEVDSANICNLLNDGLTFRKFK